MNKFFKVMTGMLALALTLGGCSTPSNSDADTTAADTTVAADTTAGDTTAGGSGEKVELRFSWWGSDNRHEAMQNVAKLYMDKNPNVTVVTEYGAFDGWQQKVLTQLSGKTEPDILQVNYNWVHSFGRGSNVFYDLNELKDIVDLSQWDQVQLDAMTVNGELGAVPHGVTARVNLYNKVLFEENGIEYPKTYDDIVAAGAIIGKDNTETGADNKYVLTNIGKVSTDLYIAQILYNQTGKVMQENGTMNYTVEDVQKALDLYKSFEESGAMPTILQDDPIQNESNPVWTSGNSGSVYEWVGTSDKYLAAYKGGEANDEIGVAPYVAANAGDAVKVYVKPSLGYAISKNCKNPEVAADFLNFMFTDEEAIKALGTSLGVSSNKATKAVQDSEGMVQGAMKEGYELLADYEQVVLDPYFEDENVRGKRYEAVEAFRTGTLSSADAAKAYVEDQQAELDKLYK